MFERGPERNSPKQVELGQVVATPGALDALQEAGLTFVDLLSRHAEGDWGDGLDAHDRRANDRALLEGTRLLSQYRLPTGVKVWIITEADRSVTTLLLPSDY